MFSRSKRCVEVLRAELSKRPRHVGRPEAASKLIITKVYVNSPGSDRGSNSSLNAEYVQIKNPGAKSVSLKGYTLRDESSHRYTFDSFTLKPGKSVKVRTGTGSDTRRNRYQDRSWYVWNNAGGDSATLRNADGKKIDRCAWDSASSYVTC